MASTSTAIPAGSEATKTIVRAGRSAGLLKYRDVSLVNRCGMAGICSKNRHFDYVTSRVTTSAQDSIEVVERQRCLSPYVSTKILLASSGFVGALTGNIKRCQAIASNFDGRTVRTLRSNTIRSWIVCGHRILLGNSRLNFCCNARLHSYGFVF